MFAQLLLAAALLAVAAAGGRADAVQKEKELDIFVVAHTHDDVGWLKTVDEYYYGANNSIQDAGVQYVLDSVVLALEADPARKFIYVEIAFFARWWREQDLAMQTRVRTLVTNGQLVFVNGGWCMSDEANTHYAAVIDQMERGHQFLWDEFQVRPTIGWQIDPFGHASETASLFARMGFEGLFFARMDYQDYERRNKTGNLEMVWRGSHSLGEATDMFTHGFWDTTYCYPQGFAFEWVDPPIQTDDRLFNVNVQQRADAFAKAMRARVHAFKTPNILVTFGCDFQFQNAHINYKNMDKLMAYINKNRATYGMTLRYSTPSEYLDAVHSYSEKNGIAYELKTDDFFPYADHPHAMWTGYFTSRPALKGYVRSRAAKFHAAMRGFSLARGQLRRVATPPDQTDMALLERFWEAFAVTQHHDAVAGTERQAVAYDYAERLALGSADSDKVMSASLGSVARNLGSKSGTAPALSTCEYLNVSVCDPLTGGLKLGQAVPVVLYNGIGWVRNEYVRLPIPAGMTVKVVGPDGKDVPGQVIPPLFGFANPNVTETLVFLAANVPPMGFATYVVEPVSAAADAPLTVRSAVSTAAAAAQVKNEYYTVNFDAKTNLWSSVSTTKSGVALPVTQDYSWYNASCGGCCKNKFPQASGAYIFRPNRTETFAVNEGPVKLQFIQGPLVEEMHSTWADWVQSSTRLYKGQDFVQVVAKIGEIPIKDHLGKEVIVRYSTALKTNKAWWTDSEGQEMQHRVRNYRPTWNYTVNEPAAGNYYPMNTAAFMRGDGSGPGAQELEFTLVTDRSKGVSSLKDGQMETMHHRRDLWDDGRGVGEPLNETEAILTTEYLTLNKRGAEAIAQQRALALRMNNPLQAFFGLADSAAAWFAQNGPTWSPLVKVLPPNAHVISLYTRADGQLLLRLGHLYATGEDPTALSKPFTLDLRTLFNDFTVTQVDELSITANSPIAAVQHRKKWNIIGEDPATTTTTAGGRGIQPAARDPTNPFVVTLNPMDIRTFALTVQQK